MSYSNPTRHRVTPGHTPTSESRVAGATHRVEHIAAGRGDPKPADVDAHRWMINVWPMLREMFGGAADHDSCYGAYLDAFLRDRR